MTANDLLTAGYFDEWMRALLARIQQPAATTAAPDVVLYSKQQLAEVLGVHVDTVGNWLSKGKMGKSGRVVKLQAFKFTSEPRIPWPALLAYHRGEEFDLDALPAPLLAPPAELQPAPLPKLHNPDTPGVLRVA